MIAILLGITDQKAALLRILDRIAQEMDRSKRDEALIGLSVLARLRHLSAIMNQERRESKMPFVIDWVNDEEVGPIISNARTEGERLVARRLIEKRFGPLPADLDARLEAMSQAEIEDLSLRLLDAATLKELFG